MVSNQENPIGVETISYALPEKILSSREVIDQHGFDEDFVLRKLGITERRVLSEGESLSDLCAEAIEGLLKETEYSPSDIELLVVVTQTGDYSIPHTSAIVQAKTGISETAMVFDISLGCSGFVAGLDVAAGTMEKLGLGVGILVTADAYSRIVDTEDRSTAPLFGDGASATLLSRDPKWLLGNSDFGTLGRMHEKLLLPGSGTNAGTLGALVMDGRAILGFTRKSVTQSVETVAHQNGLNTSNIGYFVFHQANSFVLDSLTQDLAIPTEKVIREHSDVGNTTSSSIPIALKRSIITKEVTTPVLISGFGVGLSWHSNILFPVGGKVEDK